MRAPAGSHPFRTVWCYLALAALCFRALVPDGFMLARSGQWPTIVPCPARSPELVQWLGTNAGDHHHHHHGAGADGDDPGPQAGTECPFGAPFASLLPAAPSFGPIGQTRLRVIATPPLGVARLGSTRTPPSTGPPAVLS